MNVFLFLANGFEETEAVATIDILRRGGIELATVSIAQERTVTGAHGIPIEADLLFDAVDFAGGAMLVLPGGMPGADNLNRHEGLRSQLLHYHNEGKWIAAICAAPLVLGSLRLLDGKRATAYPGFEDRLGGAIFTDAPVVKAGRIITAKGPGAVFDFGLTLVSCLAGQEKASEVAGQLLLPQ